MSGALELPREDDVEVGQARKMDHRMNDALVMFRGPGNGGAFSCEQVR